MTNEMVKRQILEIVKPIVAEMIEARLGELEEIVRLENERRTRSRSFLKRMIRKGADNGK